MPVNNDLISRSALYKELSALTMTVAGLRFGKGVLLKYMTEYRKWALQIVSKAPAVDAELKWISVKDRIPDRNDPILAVFEDGEVTRTIYTFCPPCGKLGFLFEDVYGKATHWMPMPSAPEVKHE